jgi:hypothetical protein
LVNLFAAQTVPDITKNAINMVSNPIAGKLTCILINVVWFSFLRLRIINLKKKRNDVCLPCVLIVYRPDIEQLWQVWWQERAMQIAHRSKALDLLL